MAWRDTLRALKSEYVHLVTDFFFSHKALKLRCFITSLAFTMSWEHCYIALSRTHILEEQSSCLNTLHPLQLLGSHCAFVRLHPITCVLTSLVLSDAYPHQQRCTREISGRNVIYMPSDACWKVEAFLGCKRFSLPNNCRSVIAWTSVNIVRLQL